MVALTLRQPWAWIVLHAGKNIENRKWNTKFRGEFLIHAAKGMTLNEYYDALQFTRNVLNDSKFELPHPDHLPMGKLVGIATLIDVIEPLDRDDGWHMKNQYGFILENIREIPVRDHRGALKFWNV